MPAWTPGRIDGIVPLGVGTAFPSLQLSNLDVLRRLRPGVPERRLLFGASGYAERTGFRSRAWAHEVGQPLDHGTEATCASLGAEAARVAMGDAGVGPSDIDVLICTTSTPHRMTSTMSGAVGGALGLDAQAYDLRSGCCAALFGLYNAALQLQAGASHVLLVAGETFSKVVPPHAHLAALTLADGAGAMVLGRREGAALLGGFLKSDGRYGGLVNTPGALPPVPADVDAGLFQLAGDPQGLGDVIPGLYVEAIAGALDRAGLRAADVDRYVPHQTGRDLIDGIAERFGIPSERREIAVAAHANVGSAGWIVAHAEARQAGRIRPGDTILHASVGGGMSWGAVAWRC